MKPALGRRIYDKGFIYTNSANTDVRQTFERARKAQHDDDPERKPLPKPKPPKCTCDERREWWDCSARGCRKVALQRYGETVVRFEPRPEHDLGPHGQRLKAGK
jgi:hypothetical protein